MRLCVSVFSVVSLSFTTGPALAADGSIIDTLSSVQTRMEDKGLRVTAGLLAEPEDYELLKNQPTSEARLPMSEGQPDFVFSDEEDGVLAVKNGDDIFYASLYWRARNAVNFLARVHYITPHFDRIATVTEDAQFQSSGQFYTRPDWVNFGFANGGPKYPQEMHSALAGEKLPIAQLPPGDTIKPGNEDPNAGRADFYTLRYGSYLIGMNMTEHKTFSLTVPEREGSIIELSNHKAVSGGTALKVGPRSTVVLYFSAT
jgi:hypothetical protein